MNKIKMSMRFATLASLNSRPNSIQILCEIIDTEVFTFSHSCDLESRSRSMILA